MAYTVAYCSKCSVLLFSPPEADYQKLPDKTRRELNKRGPLLNAELYADCPVCKKIRIFCGVSDLSDW